jgi:hypothetical protein
MMLKSMLKMLKSMNFPQTVENQNQRQHGSQPESHVMLSARRTAPTA